MKKINFSIGFLLMIFTSFTEAQPYLYFTYQFTDTLYGEERSFEKIQRYNLTTNLVENFPPQQFASDEMFVTTDPSCVYLAIGSIVNNFFNYLLYDSRDTSNYFVLPVDVGGIDELLYSSQRNNLCIFANDYESISVLDLTTKEIIFTLNINNIAYNNLLLYPPHSSFFSSDSSRIYFFSRDTLSEPYQVSTYSLTSNEIIQKQNLSDFGYQSTDGYDLTFGKSGKGIIKSFPNYNNPVKDFYYRIYDFDNASGSPFIYHNGLSEAYFSGNGEYLVIVGTDIDDSLRYYHTGVVKIYKTSTGQIYKTLNLPQGGKIYTFDNYPNDVYYVLNLETDPEIYNLTQLRLNSISPGISFAYAGGLTVTATGEFFTDSSVVYFNGQAKTTNYISGSVITFQLNAGDISSTGNYPVWVSNYGSNSDTLTFSVVTTLPASLTPKFHCNRVNGKIYTSFFGYNNSNNVSVFIPVGVKNKFTPTPEDRGQPVIFLPGAHQFEFSVGLGSYLTWTLNNSSVTATKTSVQCAERMEVE